MIKDSAPNVEEDVISLLTGIGDSVEISKAMPEIDEDELGELIDEITEIMAVTAEYARNEKRIDKALNDLLEKVQDYNSKLTELQENVDLWADPKTLIERIQWKQLGVDKA